MSTRAVIETDAGREIRCSKCGEFWPATPEFYYWLRGRPHSWCIACYIEARVAKGQRPGYGNQPAHGDHARVA